MEGVVNEQIAYPYQELLWRGRNDMQVRILIIEPSADATAPIVCRLVAIYLLDLPDYEILSYAWGEPGDDVAITIHGQEVFVRRNLHDAIKALRRPDTPRRLWADAVCINQEDYQEKSNIVANMHILYERADSTIIWLGKASGDSDLALDILQIGEDLKTQKSKDELAILRSVRKKPPSPEMEKHWIALGNLFGRSYWSRTWIVQEIAHSRRFFLQVGERVLPFHWVMSASNRLNNAALKTHNVGNDTYYQLRGMQTVIFAMSLWMDIYKRKLEDDRHPLPPLGRVLSHFRDFRSTDPRDKVYGCFMLASKPPGISREQIDYSEPCGKLYTRIARSVIEEDLSLRLLSSCDTFRQDGHAGDLGENLTLLDGYQRRDVPGLPSWAPNWATNRISFSLAGDFEEDMLDGRIVGLENDHAHYSAAGNTRAEFHFSADSLTLTVSGVMLDVVVDRSSHLYGKPFPEVYIEAMAVCMRNSNVAARYFSSPLEVLRIAMAGNRNSHRHKMSAEILAVLQAGPPFSQETIDLLCLTGVRAFFTTRSGYLGLGPLAMRTTDTVCLLKGCFVPMVLRKVKITDGVEERDDSGDFPHEETSFYRVIGPAYVHGVMEGEEAAQLDGDKVVEFILR